MASRFRRDVAVPAEKATRSGDTQRSILASTDRANELIRIDSLRAATRLEARKTVQQLVPAPRALRPLSPKKRADLRISG
jgi:hypothetical protein